MFTVGAQGVVIELRDPTTQTVLATPFTTIVGSPNPLPTMAFDVAVGAFAGMTVELVVQVQANNGCLFAQFDHFRFEE
jgi:hypothetical protein